MSQTNMLLLDGLSLEYLSDRSLEEFYGEVPENVLEWADRFKGFKDEAGYLVKSEGDYGFLLVKEYWHTGMKDDIARDFVKTHPKAKSSNIIAGIFRVLNKLILDGIKAKRVGYGTGMGALGSHEFYVFFPFGSNNEEYEKIYNLLVKYEREVFDRFYRKVG